MRLHGGARGGLAVALFAVTALRHIVLPSFSFITAHLAVIAILATMATYNQSNMYFTANVNSGSNESNYAFPSSFMPVGQTISEEGVQDLLRTGQNMITIGQNMISNGERMILLAQGATATQGLQSAGVQPSWSTISTTETQQTGLTERPWPSKPPEQRFTSLSLSQDHDTTAPLPQYASPSGYLQTDPVSLSATFDTIPDSDIPFSISPMQRMNRFKESLPKLNTKK